MNNKIEDNPSFLKIAQDMKGLKIIGRIAFFLSPLSKTARNILRSTDKLKYIEKKVEEISKSPDQFNHYFSSKGWIAHESMNHALMLDCIALAKRNDLENAEVKLADHYTSETLKGLISQLKSIPEFQKRYELASLAYQDTIAKRFHSAVPVILMIIDGVVNDIDRSKGFFTATTDLTAWDSIAAHSSGLAKLRDILNKGRTKTNSDEIFLPYRNGILHGRDIKYANKYVAAKCWATLIAIHDWAHALKKINENPPIESKTTSFKESLSEIKNTLDNYSKHQAKMKEMKTALETWKPRPIEIGKDIQASGNVDAYSEFTPERDAIKFFSNWEKKNYGGIAHQIHYFSKKGHVASEAGRVRKIFDKKLLRDYRIVSLEDCAPSISEIVFDVLFEYDGTDHRTEIRLRLIYQNENGETLILGQKGGDWKFVESYFFPLIEHPVKPIIE